MKIPLEDSFLSNFIWQKLKKIKPIESQNLTSKNVHSTIR